MYIIKWVDNTGLVYDKAYKNRKVAAAVYSALKTLDVEAYFYKYDNGEAQLIYANRSKTGK